MANEDDILEVFSSKENHNYVILGKNGAGKTSYLKKINEEIYKSNTLLIPSNRRIEIDFDNNLNVKEIKSTRFTTIFSSSKYNNPTDLLIQFFFSNDYQELTDNKLEIINGKNIGKTASKILNIFNNLGLERNLCYDTTTKELYLYNDDLKIDKYTIDSASDGEKSILQLIICIMLCPQDWFVFIDEPETHLNTALLAELFTILENERQDLVFIYCTHNIEFIETRNNCQFVLIEHYNGRKWTRKILNCYEEISKEILLGIVGTRKNIIFVEGNRNSYDYKLYSLLFDKYKVIPLSSCEKIIETCKSIKDFPLIIDREIYGIIDNDYRFASEIEKLEKQNIYTISYNEVENILLSKCIFDEMLPLFESLSSKQKEIKEKMTNEIIKKTIKDKNVIINDFIDKVFNKLNKKNKYTYDDSMKKLEENINTNFEEIKRTFFDKLNEFTNKIDMYIEKKDTESIIKELSNKGFLPLIKNIINVDKDRYFNMVISMLKNNKKLKEVLIKEIFGKEFVNKIN